MAATDRRERILRAAGPLFVRRGYSGVSMEDVLAAVGGSKATLYRYFPDKTELFRSSVGVLIDELSKPVRVFRPRGNDIAANLRAYGRHFAAIVLADDAIALHRLVTAEAERVGGLGATFFAHGPAVGNSILGRYLRAHADTGALVIPDPVLLGAQLYQAMVGQLQMRLLLDPTDRPTRTEINRHVGLAVETFLAGRSVR